MAGEPFGTADVPDPGREPDRISALIARLASGEPDEATGRELYAEVHRAIYPMCVNMLGSHDAARDAEQETWRRLLEHLRRRDPAAPAIIQGTAYVREIARNVCRDLGRQASDLRREKATDMTELGELPTPVPDPAIADMTPPSPRTPADRTLSDAFGYRAKQLMDDIAGLSEQELKVLALRLQGMSYGQVADHLGQGLTAATAQTQGERAMHHLRGRVHVTVWHQEPLGAWTMPRCPRLAQLKTEAQRRLTAGGTITTTLYRDIGKHLDPHPNRSRTRGDEPACQLCHPELKRCEANYLWLLGTIPPLVGLATAAPPPAPQPAAYSDRTPVPDDPRSEPPSEPSRSVPAPQQAMRQLPGAPPAPPAAPQRRRKRSRGRTMTVLTLVLILILVIGAIGTVVVPPLLAGKDPLQALPFGLGRPAAQAPEACKLLTPDEISGILNEEIEPCEQKHYTAAQDDTYKADRYDAIFTGKDRGDGVPPSEIDISTYNLGTVKAAQQARICSGDLISTLTPVANLGDEACRRTMNVGSLAFEIQILVRKGSILFEMELTRALRGSTDEGMRIANVAVGRIG
jgi:RNA polymerase sigma factor (sigma-70 family)